MTEYIDLDEKIVVSDTRGREIETTVRHILEMNKGSYTAADVRPVVHATWETDTCHFYCSECEHYVDYKTNFCPNCGAEMEES